VSARQLEIQIDEVESRGQGERQACVAIGGELSVVTGLAEKASEGRSQRRFIFDDQDAHFVRQQNVGHGAPRSGLLRVAGWWQCQ